MSQFLYVRINLKKYAIEHIILLTGTPGIYSEKKNIIIC